MTTRILVERLCPEHGVFGSHTYGDYFLPCTHADMRVLAEGEYLLIEKVDGEWPEDVVQRAVNGLSIWDHVGKKTHLYVQLRDRAVGILDALAERIR